MNITKIAYLAGIVDGEGTIQIIRQRNENNSKPLYVTGAIYITNSSIPLLDWIQSNFGGNRTKARSVVGKNWKPVYRVQFYGAVAENLVETILPFLVIKQEQAKLFLELRRRMKQYKHPLSAAERATREELAVACQQLNRRGIGQDDRLSELAPSNEG